MDESDGRKAISTAAAIPIGMVIGLIDDLPSCAELIERIVAEASAIVTERLPHAIGA